MNAEIREYLLSYGVTGEFGRFRPVQPLDLVRGDRAVVRTHRGLELGICLGPARPGHAHFLPNTTVGQLLHLATPADDELAERVREHACQLFDDARRLTVELGLPLEIIDTEVLLDGEHAIVHHLAWGAFDERELVSRLASRHDLRVALHSLAVVEPEEEHAHGCGREDCGQKEGGGGCSTCGTGGCGSCGSTDLKGYFAELRQKMEEASRNRVPLA